MSNLSDNELRKALQQFGYEPGPITASTRGVYVNKLEKFNSEAKESSKSVKTSKRITRASVVSPRRTRTSDIHTVESDDTSSRLTGVEKRRTNDFKMLNYNDHPASTIRSRDSDVFSSPIRYLSKVGPQNLHSVPWATPARPSSGRLTAPSFRPNDSVNQKPGGGNFRTPNQPSAYQIPRENTPQRGAGHTPTRKTYIYYENTPSSDSENENTPNRSGSLLNTVSRVTGWLRGNQDQNFSKVTPPRIGGRPSTGSNKVFDDRFQVSDTDLSDAEGLHRTTHSQRLRNSLSRIGSHRDAGTGTSSSLLFTPPCVKDQAFNSTVHSSASILSDDELDADSHEKYRFGYAKHDSSYLQDSTCTSRTPRWLSSIVTHIPNMILVGSIFIVFVLVLMYLVLRDHHGEVGKLAALQKIVCDNSVFSDASTPTGIHGCLHQNDLNEALPVFGMLFDILSRYAGEFHCSVSGLSSARMPIASARGLVERKWLSTATAESSDNAFKRIWTNALFIVLHVGKLHFNLIAYDTLGEELYELNKTQDIYEFECTQPYYSGMCRLRRLFHWMAEMCMNLLWTTLLVSIAVCLLLCIRWFRNRHLMALERKSARIRDLVAEIVHLLQQQLRENEANPEQPPYVPVYVLRDRLRQKHTDMAQLWPEILRYVYAVETCIGVREWRGLGETWQWQGGTGWQGSALVDKSQKPPFIVPPTECLKIRDMFSTENLDQRAQLRIKRELLNKLVGCGSILHIGLDAVGSKGLVYLKCANADVAGRVYHTIHANYFDGRLLMVKFLRNGKYCLRFPEARNVREPLHVDNLN